MMCTRGADACDFSSSHTRDSNCVLDQPGSKTRVAHRADRHNFTPSEICFHPAIIHNEKIIHIYATRRTRLKVHLVDIKIRFPNQCGVENFVSALQVDSCVSGGLKKFEEKIIRCRVFKDN